MVNITGMGGQDDQNEWSTWIGIYTPLSGIQNLPETVPAIDKYDASLNFTLMYSTGTSDRIRWWIIDPKRGEKIILWDYPESKVGILLHHSFYRMNFWQTNNWPVEGNPNAIEKPLHP